MSCFNLAPYEYIHVKDMNTGTTRVVMGPKTFIPQEQEKVLFKTPKAMVSLGKRDYCVVHNPIMLKDGKPVYDKYGQIKNQHGEVEYRFHKDYSEPFPLHPNEIQKGQNNRLTVVQKDEGLKIKASRDFTNEAGVRKVAGDEWIVVGLTTYYPRVEEDVVKAVKSLQIMKGEALRCRAQQEFTGKDESGKDVTRTSGMEWLWRKVGSYLPHVHEVVEEKVVAKALNEGLSLILTATQSFTDVYGMTRKAGEEWMITHKDASSHILDVYEKIQEEAKLVVLTKSHYCVVMDPWNAEKRTNSKGAKVVRVGETSFFLQPGERLENGIQDIHVLSEKDAVLVRANEKFVNRQFFDAERYGRIMALWNAKKTADLSLAKNINNGYVRAIMKSEVSGLRTHEAEFKDFTADELAACIEDQVKLPGDKWMVYGPLKYVPPVSVEYIETRSEIPLDKREGVYVRNIKTGNVRSVVGETYMLKTDEELSEINLSTEVVGLLQA
jgi:major vault protein